KISVRKKQSFRMRLAGADALQDFGVGQAGERLLDTRLSAHGRPQLGERPSFDNSQAVLRDVAFGELLKQLPWRQARLELVVACLDIAVAAGDARHNNERKIERNHTGIAQIARNGFHGAATFYVEAVGTGRKF